MTPYYDNSSLSNLPDATRAVVFEVVGEAIQRIRRALQVVPVSGNLFAERFCTATFSTIPPVCHSIAENELCLEMPMPDDHFASIRYCDKCTSSGCTVDSCTITPAGTGVSKTDFLVYVRAEDTDTCKSSNTLAYASTCQHDQYDRPTFGMVNFCPNKLSTSDSVFERQVSTALHEFSHALGFSSRFFPLMRGEDGTPRTPRDEIGNPPILNVGTCPNGKQIDYYVEPSNTTIKYSTERNHVVAKMVTPRVRAFVRDHFNCSTLEGAEIESQDGGCIGSHWEERLFEPEFMTPVDSYHNVFSALTLAFFADSGWYQVNASTSEVMHFGRKKGCSFATEKCIDSMTQAPIAADTFCTTFSTEFQGCSVDASSRAICSLSTENQSIPTEYQYFPDQPTKGGANSFADFCPLVLGYTAGDCTISTNLLQLGKSNINAFGETYCPTCKCTQTSLRSEDSTLWTINPPRQSGCYAMRCFVNVNSSVTVQLTIPRSAAQDSVNFNCTIKGEKLSVPGFSGDITCPDPAVVCEGENSNSDLLAFDDTRATTNSSSSGSSDTGSGTIMTGTESNSVELHKGSSLWALFGGSLLAAANMM
ncbi:hypothetical protein PPTG_03405 [Phytophthora nicotianae INRA-310]|uniref:Leishmanolysin-like peptidase n=2 Tax=Phytophthora nicotianae TaxID=4792 RepID=W2R6R1_PHYN3|nr:hypothetical protein PPTG_03405 [Phytophthora nicotianae INRA-310]ETN20384.1 hypothetical protein PPTG_03405 [Phytophthora nicotianae INRA-310]ETO70022.1 hypothetical protein F444_13465 [Phytophthora nicotianae P1976]